MVRTGGVGVFQDGVTDLDRLEGETMGDSDLYASVVTEQSKHTGNKIIKVCGKWNKETLTDRSKGLTSY